MSQIVKCDVCGRLYNQSYLTSHKRLAHDRKNATPFSIDETKAVDTIIALFRQVSAKTRKDVLDRLTAVPE